MVISKHFNLEQLKEEADIVDVDHRERRYYVGFCAA